MSKKNGLEATKMIGSFKKIEIGNIIEYDREKQRIVIFGKEHYYAIGPAKIKKTNHFRSIDGSQEMAAFDCLRGFYVIYAHKDGGHTEIWASEWSLVKNAFVGEPWPFRCIELMIGDKDKEKMK